MFSKLGTYPAVGLFSLTHIISIFVCFIIIGLAVFFTRKMKKESYFKLLKVFTIIITLLELFKIIWTLFQSGTTVNAWVPLYFCSLFIYSLWLTCSKNRFIKDMGLAFIAFAGVVAGAAFIISPSTSFNFYPIFHFQCIYSMLYHSIMVYAGLMLFVTKVARVDMKLFFKYCIFCAIFMALATLVNLVFDGNMMFFNSPSGIPFNFLHTIYNFSHTLYTFIMILAHLALGLLVLAAYKLISLTTKRHKQTKNE